MRIGIKISQLKPSLSIFTYMTIVCSVTVGLAYPERQRRFLAFQAARQVRTRVDQHRFSASVSPTSAPKRSFTAPAWRTSARMG